MVKAIPHRRRAAVIILGLVLLVSCGILPGDKGLPIAFVNRTGETIVLYEKGRENATYRRELTADARWENVWIDSRLPEHMKDRAIYRVEATRLAGELVFCHVYSFNELTRLGWLVEVRTQNDCLS